MEAGYSKNSKIVRALISAGADVNAKTDDDSGWTALLSAAHNGESPEIVKILISAGADINAKTEAGFRANVNAKDNTDYEPVLLKGDDLNKPKLLARKKHTAPHVGAIDNAQMYTGRNNSEIAKTTVLMYAAEKNNSEIVSIFIKAGAEDSLDEFGQNALMHAVERSNNPKIVEILIKAGSLVNLEDKNGNTPLKLAQACKDNKVKTKIISLLKNAGAKK